MCISKSGRSKADELASHGVKGRECNSQEWNKGVWGYKPKRERERDEGISRKRERERCSSKTGSGNR